MHFQELEDKDTESPSTSRDTNMYSTSVDIDQTLQRESDDSDHNVVESNTEPTDHVEHSIDSDNSDNGDNLLEFEDCVNLFQSDTDTDSSTDDEVNNALDKLKEWTIENHVTDSSTSIYSSY